MADISLAIIPLGLQAFMACVQGYKLFTEAKQLGHGSQILLWKLRIQETRLNMWGREWGFLDQAGNQSLEVRELEDHRVVLETLIRISDLLKDYKTLKRRYGLSLISDDPDLTPQVLRRKVVRRSCSLTSRKIAGSSLDEFITEEFSKFHRQDTDLHQQRSRENSVLRKFRWAVSDKSKLEAIVSDLKDYNDGLYHLLSAVERRSLRQGLSAEVVTSNNVSELEEIETASSAYENVQQVASLRQHNLTITPFSQIIPSESIQIPGNKISFDQGSSSSISTEAFGRTLATYNREGQSEAVPVEWKHFDREASDSARVAQLSRLDTLARLLHTSAKPVALCVPRCLGYISDD